MVVIILFLLFISEFSTTTGQLGNSSITLGSSLSPTGPSNWSSHSGQFAFGFYQKGNGYAVGIWFNRISRRTVIWTANRDAAPLSRDVQLIFTSDGKLILQQNQGESIAIVDRDLPPASSASMLDDGNFVLKNSSSSVIWQSFDTPTDTILPGQPLLAGQKLVSSVSETNHSAGKFQLIMQSDGNLVQYPIDVAKPETAYWNTSTFTAGATVSLNLDVNGKLYLRNGTGFNIMNLYEGSPFSTGIYRLTIDADGILGLYSSSSDQNGDWTVEWSPTTNRCVPRGLCGLNGYCLLTNQNPQCVCLPGFYLTKPGQNNSDCERNVSMSKNGDIEYNIIALEDITWEDDPYSVLSMTRQACIENCLSDGNCEAALYKNQQCRKQRLPLRFGSQEGGVTTLFKVGNFSSVGKESRKEESRKELRIIVILSTSISFFLAISGVVIYRYAYKRVSNQGNDRWAEDVALRPFMYHELEKATNGFRDEVGKGAFGTVFKGAISNGKTVAIKRLEKMMAEGEWEFQNEMKSIGRTHHKNLVRLLGYCHDGSNRLLVYEYMTNGSLADFLFKSERKPIWEERIEIALSVARGILYLHEECETQIIHCDIKPENILMDEKGCAKIADFGLAKLLMPNQTRTYTGIRGTRGYVAPEWHRNLPITVKADVYSFGIMLMEIICCRRSLDMNLSENEVVLVDYVYDCFEARELDKLVRDEEMDGMKLQRMVKVGLWCIQDEPSVRPLMKKVVLMMEGTVDIPAPPRASFASSMSREAHS